MYFISTEMVNKILYYTILLETSNKATFDFGLGGGLSMADEVAINELPNSPGVSWTLFV